MKHNGMAWTQGTEYHTEIIAPEGFQVHRDQPQMVNSEKH